MPNGLNVPAPMQTPLIAIIVGSTRQGRFADKPVQWISELGSNRKDLRFEVVDLRDFPMPFFDEAGSPAAVPPTNVTAVEWGKKLATFDGFIFVTPEYNHGITAVLKNALDYAYKEWNYKPAAFVGYGAVGAARAIQNLRMTAATLRMAPISKAVHLTMAEVQGIQGGKTFATFPHLEQSANAMLEELSLWLKALRPMRQCG